MAINTAAELLTASLSPEVIKDLAFQLQRFFNCETEVEIKCKIESIKETLVTESFGELDKDDKWEAIGMLKRITDLVDLSALILQKFLSAF